MHRSDDRIERNIITSETGQHLLGTRAGTIDRGAETFFFEKKGGKNFFYEKKGGENFFRKEKRRKIKMSVNKKTFMRPKSKLCVGPSYMGTCWAKLSLEHDSRIQGFKYSPKPGLGTR